MLPTQYVSVMMNQRAESIQGCLQIVVIMTSNNNINGSTAVYNAFSSNDYANPS